MGHHPEHVTALVDDARDVVQGSVRVGARSHSPVRIAVTEDDLAVLFEARERCGVGEIAALAVGDWDTNHLTLRALRCVGQIVAVDHQIGPLAAKLEGGVADQRAWQESRLAQDLEAVADAPDKTAPVRELSHFFHDRCKPRDRPRAQVVTIGKAAGQDDAIASFEVRVLVPQVGQLLAEHLVDDPAAVAIGPRAREDENSELHRRWRPSCSISK